MFQRHQDSFIFTEIRLYTDLISSRRGNTGLDLRVFDDAITFKIALMVVKYMKYMESKDTF